MAIKDDILSSKRPAQQQHFVKETRPVTPIAQKIKADVALKPNATLSQPTEQVIPKRSEAETFDEIARRRSGYTPQTKEEEAKEKKRQKVEQLFRSVGDGISSIVNLHYAIKGAPSVYDPKNSLTAANQARWDKYYKEREAKRLRYQQELDKLWKEHKDEKRLEEDREYQRGRDKAADARQARTEDRMERQFQWQQEQAAATAKRATEEADKQRKHNAEQNAANRKHESDLYDKRNDNPLYLGEDEMVDMPKSNYAIAQIFKSLPKELQAEAMETYGTRDANLQPKPLTAAQMQSAVAHYITYPEADAARDMARRHAGRRPQGASGAPSESTGNRIIFDPSMPTP